MAMEPITIGISDEERERRRREEEAREAESASIAEEAIAGLGDLDMPEDAPRPAAADVIGEASEGGSSWRDVPSARATEGGAVFPPQPPARTPPSLASMGESAQPMRREAVAPPSAPMQADPVVRDTPVPMEPPPSALGARQTAPAPPAASPPASPRAPEPLAALGDPAAPKKPAMREPGRMDEGLPSEADISGARDGDTVRRILHALGAGILGYSGRSAPAFRSDADPMQARRDAGMQRAQAAKGDAIERQDRLGREESQMELQRAALEDRGNERQASQQMQERRMALTERTLDRDIADEERTRSADAALDIVESPASQSARTLLAARLSQLPEVQRRAAIEAIGGVDALPTMTGRQARELLGGNILARAPQMRGGQGGGAGAGNPVRRGRAPTEQDRAALTEEAERLGIPLAAAETMSLGDLQREILARGRTDQAAARRAETQRERDAARAGGDELIPGSGITAGGRLGAGEAARWRTGYASALSSMSGLRRVEAIAQRHGRMGAISPAARAQLTPELTMLRAMVADMGGTGVINPTEVPTITAALPDPSNAEQATFETFGDRLEQWKRILEDGVRARATVMGVSPDSSRRIVQGLRTGRIPDASRPAAATAPAGRVRVRRADGQTGTVSQEVFEADQRGARQYTAVQ